MPNIITHTLFADEMLEKLNNELLTSRKQLFEVGSNGPDFLFFHNLTPTSFLKTNKLRKLGSAIHKGKINEFYRKAIDIIRNEKDPEIQKDMIAYVAGHLCHWALDSTTHPYVFYRTGDCKGESAWQHHRFESMVDAIMLKVKRNQTVETYDITKICDLSLEQARAIIRIYKPIGEEIFGVKANPHEYYQSLQDWHFMQKAFHDKTGIKFNTINTIERIFNKEYIVSGCIVPNNTEEPYDTMNIMKKRWVHPCNDEKILNDNFFELYDKAQNLAMKIIPVFLKAIEQEDSVGDFMYILHDKNYNLGMNKSLPMKYFDVIY